MKRKQLNVEDFEVIPEGDVHHPVWQAAYGASVTNEALDNKTFLDWHYGAMEKADAAYAAYAAMGGVIAKKSKKRKDEPSYQFGQVTVEKETEKAILVISPGQDRENGTWVPKSQIHQESEVEGDGDEGILYVTQWYAEQNNLMESTTDDRVPF